MNERIKHLVIDIVSRLNSTVVAKVSVSCPNCQPVELSFCQ